MYFLMIILAVLSSRATQRAPLGFPALSLRELPGRADPGSSFSGAGALGSRKACFRGTPAETDIKLK